MINIAAFRGHYIDAQPMIYDEESDRIHVNSSGRSSAAMVFEIKYVRLAAVAVWIPEGRPIDEAAVLKKLPSLREPAWSAPDKTGTMKLRPVEPAPAVH